MEIRDYEVTRVEKLYSLSGLTENQMHVLMTALENAIYDQSLPEYLNSEAKPLRDNINHYMKNQPY